jgi:3-oxoadipyl-CoA thiolase
MHDAVIINSLRTPIGNLGGALSSIRPDDLAGFILKALVERTKIDPTLIDEVILGCTNQAGEDNRDVARMAVLLADLPMSIPAVTVNRLCASGLTAVSMAERAIKSGETNAILAGGVESMSRAPYSIPKADRPFPFGNITAWDTALGWRYPNPKLVEKGYTETLGETAENIAEKYDLTRDEQDSYALESHHRAIDAIDSGKFKEEIIPVKIAQKKGEIIFETDERPRRDTSMEALKTLKPAFHEAGTVTAGNSSGMNDGAAALLITSDEFAKQHGLKPIAQIVTSAAMGVDPRFMGLGPIPASLKALKQANLTISEMGLIELNEAFAAQALAVMRDLHLNHEITNVNGGAIALGHPLGCSGARLLTTLLHEMSRRSATTYHPFYGLVSLCVGVGQGESMIIEFLG